MSKVHHGAVRVKTKYPPPGIQYVTSATKRSVTHVRAKDMRHYSLSYLLDKVTMVTDEISTDAKVA